MTVKVVALVSSYARHLLSETLNNTALKFDTRSTHADTLTACVRGRDLSKVTSETDDERVAVTPGSASAAVPSFSVSPSSTEQCNSQITTDRNITNYKI